MIFAGMFLFPDELTHQWPSINKRCLITNVNALEGPPYQLFNLLTCQLTHFPYKYPNLKLLFLPLPTFAGHASNFKCLRRGEGATDQ